MFRRRMTLMLALLLVLALALGGVATAQTTTELVYWWLLPGASNQGKTCAFLDDIYAQPDTLWMEGKIDPPGAGTFVLGPLTVTISNYTPNSFDFTTNIPIDAVVVKDGADGASFFVYDGLTAPADGATNIALGTLRTPETMLDTYLTTPGTNAISHISFCYDAGTPIVKSGYKWHDLNANGEWDMDEPPLQDWQIYVDYNNNGQLDMGEPYDITRPDGYYEIVGINPGTWKVREVGQDGWFCSFPTTSDTYGCYHEEVFEPGGTYPDNNFGNYQLVSVTACKLEDVDTNPATADDRIPVEGWTVYLIKDDVRQAPDQVTGEDGCYTWTDLMPGYTYGVGEEVPDNWYPWTPTEYDFGLGLSGDAFSYTFVNSEKVDVTACKLEDVDADPATADDRIPVPGWPVQLTLNGVVVDEQVTGDDGCYTWMDLDPLAPPNYYDVHEEVLEGWFAWTPTDVVCDPIPSGGTCNVAFVNSEKVDVTACKLEDVDTNPATADDRIPVPGWPVQLTLNGVVVDEQVTGDDGCYTWMDLDPLAPPNYYDVHEEVLEGWFAWTPTDVTCDPIPSGGTCNVAFVNSEKVDVTACKLEDVDADPATADDRIPVPGWPVQLTLNGVVVDEQVTGDDGCYTWMDLDPLAPPNYYDVHEEVLEGWFAWTPTDVVCDPIPSGGTCSVAFVNSEYAAKSGYKWNDLNMDGIWDMDEPVLSGWRIDLLSDGVVVAFAITDEFGMYEFDMVMPGQTLLVCEVLEPNWTQTYPTTGAMCPDGYGPYGYEITLQSGQVETDNNFGNYRDLGCTYTQGYWKTHSEFGPAPYDPRWVTAVTPLGASTPFLNTDPVQTWYQVFQGKPKAGNAYYILAHQYMAAMLNVMNGASSYEVAETLALAKELLERWPGGVIPRTSPDRALAIQYAYTLDQFNNGYLGVPHCDDIVVAAGPSLLPAPFIIDLSDYR